MPSILDDANEQSNKWRTVRVAEELNTWIMKSGQFFVPFSARRLPDTSVQDWAEYEHEAADEKYLNTIDQQICLISVHKKK